MTDLLDFLADQVADSEVAWSLGTFGALAEFMRDADEPVVLDRDEGAVSAVTARGALRITRHPELRPVASESLTTGSWSHRVALCLPETSCATSRRTELTEAGLDREALREEDRAGVLFDLGLGALQADFYVRSGDPDVIAALRSCAGKSVFSPGSGVMEVILATDPHRVFVSRLGRIEVYQPIPPADGKSPSGPHTHVLPKLLAHGRTHSANEPLPPGWIPCAHIYPPHPARDLFGQSRPFQAERHVPSRFCWRAMAIRTDLRSSSASSIRSRPAASPLRYRSATIDLIVPRCASRCVSCGRWTNRSRRLPFGFPRTTALTDRI
jgi:hypothetical protein